MELYELLRKRLEQMQTVHSTTFKFVKNPNTKSVFPDNIEALLL